ncbi:MAG: type II secretion system protein F [Clostridiales bacterium GWB2_37_7]|nr:MAG: type II secretion system protein F [Clostridiales bacterium GWB2_37_7]
MARYKYKAITAEGKTLEGFYEANSKDEVLVMLRQNQFFPINVIEDKLNKDIDFSVYFSKVKIKDIAIFCRQFHTMLQAGVSLISCLDILRLQTERKTFKTAINKLYEKVQQGLTLSEAMHRHSDVFPELLINMVMAGEASGNLDVILNRMAVHYEKETKIINKVKGAMVYPIVLAIVAFAVVIFLLVFVLPTFTGLFESSGAELPTPTKILLALSGFLINYWYIAIVMNIAFIFLIVFLLKLPKFKYYFDGLKFKIPIIKGINQKVITSRLSRTLATLLSSGLPLLQVLDIASKIVNNRVIEDGLDKAKEDVKRGILLSVPIKRMNLFPPMFISMLTIGEESGSIDEILDKTANYYDDEAEAALEAMTKLVEPLMLVVMAVVIGSIVGAIILPMFDMLNSVAM